MERKERFDMIDIIGTNIISSLGFTSDENYENVKQGVSGVRHYDEGTFDLPEAFMASLVDKEQLNNLWASHSCHNNNYTDLEKATVISVMDANRQAKIDLSSKKTLFVLSTTKGNIHWLEETHYCRLDPQSPVFLWNTAKKITAFFQNPNTPVVISNACISGACALIAAMRELKNSHFDYVVVAGVDFLSKFIISGFQSLKALSPERCKPFDKDRCGLNLGEAAACVIMGLNRTSGENAFAGITLRAGAIRNDANHISAPSRTGEGSYRVLKNILQGIDKEQIAFINAHGTATPYNDAMEMQAIYRAGLSDIPVNSLKTFFGHTLGAAGILESIISMQALSESTDKRYFIKMLSGFAGCNAGLLFEKIN